MSCDASAGLPRTTRCSSGFRGDACNRPSWANIVRRSADRAGLAKLVTAHTLRHTAATWLRQETGDARLVAEFLGHADLSTVSRYAHVATTELHAEAAVIAERAQLEQRKSMRFARGTAHPPQQLQLVP